jgi:hypothetical protein
LPGWQFFALVKRDAGKPERPRSFVRKDSERQAPAHKREARECAVLAGYQMSCLAQQLSIGGFDLAAGSRCSCERDGGHCIERIR